MKKITLLFSMAILLIVALFLLSSSKEVKAQYPTPDYACMGQPLADYMNAVIAGAGSLPNIRLLSPAFNMTSFTFDGIINAMTTVIA